VAADTYRHIHRIIPTKGYHVVVKPRGWLGLDIGTSSTKAMLVDDAGRVLGRGHATYDTSFAPNGCAEQRPYDYLDAVRRAIEQCGAGGSPLAGIGLVGQTPTLVLVAEDGAPVRPAMTWQDTRASEQARELGDELGSSERLFGTELPWAPTYPPAKLLWLARYEPAVLDATRWALQPKDFVGLHLTGSPLSDPWSSKGVCNVLDGLPATEALARVGWPARIAPPCAPAWTARGEVTARAAQAFGVPAGTTVSVGWSDALGGMLAAGAFADETGFVLSGTSSIVGMSTRDEGAVDSRLLSIPTACAPLRVVYGPTTSGGSSLEWIADVLGTDVDGVLALAAERPSGADGAPSFVPYLAGERAPIWRSDVGAALLGLSSRHGRADIARAVVDGVCLSERHVLSISEEAVGREAASVRVAGRGVSRSVWRDARRAALARPLLLLDEPDASALGAAMLALAAAEDGDLAGANRLRSDTERVERAPDAAAFDRYEAASHAALAWADGLTPRSV
jgi:xylulokinase